MSQRVFVSGVAIILVALAFCLTNGILGPTPGPTEANARRIKVGMQMEAVAAILGGPGELGSAICSGSHLRSTYYWDGPDGVVRVYFGQIIFAKGPAGVEDVFFTRFARPNLLDRIVSWFGG